MNGFEILEHRGDVKIRARGRTREELFQNALEGMMAVLNAKFKVKNEKIRQIRVEAPEINSLLVDFLSEVNYLRQVNMEAYQGITFSKFSDTALEGKLEGYSAEEFGEDIKAVTFHDLNIHQNEKGDWETDIVFDV